MTVLGPSGLARLTMLIWLFWPCATLADGLLDGRVFTGMIGPADNPDLADSLHFDDGHFWSDICTRCGFVPGDYTAEMTEKGIVFRGRLESDSRGRFDYEGLVRDDGTIQVSIRWEKKRWYWTTRREIAFHGTDAERTQPQTLNQVRLKMSSVDPGANPLCARF